MWTLPQKIGELFILKTTSLGNHIMYGCILQIRNVDFFSQIQSFLLSLKYEIIAQQAG